MSETVLIVDDEDSVRRTFQEWLAHSGFDCRVLVAADAESALQHANRQAIDLAILDWNLGSGSDGLQLLEDLSLFHPDVVAILVTGFAHQATPLDALRMGVRDYLDKNQDLNRDSFLRAVRKQLDRIAPAKRQRAFNQSLKEFREAVEKILPLVQAASALNEPLPLPHAVGSLFRFLLRATGAADGALLVRQVGDDGETYRAYGADGQPLNVELVPFAQSIAATAASIQEPCAMGRDELAAVTPQPFERGRNSLLAAPLNVGPGYHAVMELFDKAGGAFTDADRRLAQAAADFGGEVLRQALAEGQKHQLLFDAVGAALGATERLAAAPAAGTAEQRMEQPPPPEVMETLREGLNTGRGATVDADATLQLAEAVRVLALRHGPAAVRHCTRVVQSLREMLDAVTGME
ncbi:MAG: response regulator [Gemmataceae bacterium]